MGNSGLFEVCSTDVGGAGSEYFIFGARDNMRALARFRSTPDPSEYTGRSVQIDRTVQFEARLPRH
ncbi:MAG: hypothetical protein ACREDM_16095 [Methylocella sp.]